LSEHCLQAVAACGLQAVAQLFHTFPDTHHGPGGVTATVLLAESHLCLHTWPEQHAVTLDVMCAILALTTAPRRQPC
jgi:S-adenosylmethionine decarboxylase